MKDNTSMSASESKSHKVAKVSESQHEGMMEVRLRDLGAKLDELIARAGKLKDKAGDKVGDLKVKGEEAKQKLTEVKETSGEAWKEFKPGLERSWDELCQAWEELKTASEKAASKFQGS